MSLLVTLCQVRAGNEEAFEALLRQLTPQFHRYQPWTRMAADSADLHQELRVTLWFALQTHPPQILQQIFGLGGETHDF